MKIADIKKITKRYNWEFMLRFTPKNTHVLTPKITKELEILDSHVRPAIEKHISELIERLYSGIETL